ncbi:MAG TPA: RagB/SusD family nutrient uptake outer membrane protein [Gemmatimonadaceae bacterium]|nr:RagB/SusD family nutrient uptake outer membrane protein [Gemmatimonadaceae bacterium]
MAARAGVLLTLAAMAGSLSACDPDELLNVDSPSRIPAENLESPANAELMVNSAIADFECAAGAYFVVSGLIGEELLDGLQTADRYPYDQRSLTPADRRYQAFDCTAIGTYLPLQTARASADRVQRYLEQWTDAEVAPVNRTSGIATMALYGGYARIYLGEGFCSMAISSVFGTEVNYGGEISPDSVFRQAETKFTEAIAAATAPADSLRRRAAYLGRARARLNLGDFAGAKADASQIPAGFAFNASASTTNSRRENRMWAQNNPNTDATMVDTLYVQRNDPRIPVQNPPTNGSTTVTGVLRYRQLKYPTASTAFPIATYEEAQLILAEAEREVGTIAQALIHLNNVRARGNRGALVTLDRDVLLAEIIEERRRELFLEGHHLGDVIRYNIALQPPAGSPYHGSGTYGTRSGTNACMPLPNNERLNNPNVPDNP